MFVLVHITNKGFVGQYEFFEVRKYQDLIIRSLNDGWQIISKIRVESGELAIMHKAKL